MVYSINIILAYIIAPVFILLSIYLTFKVKYEYRNYQKRSKCTSILCLIYHETFVALACYIAWYNIWPFFNFNVNLSIHLLFTIFGINLILIGSVFYILYLMGIRSVLRAIGRNSDTLITGGIYRITRNPQSLSRIIGLIGVAILGRSFFALILAIIWIIINHFNILIEENYLENKFGDSYQQYCSLTPRYYKINQK